MRASNPRPAIFHQRDVTLFESGGRKIFTVIKDGKSVDYAVKDYSNGFYTGVPVLLSHKESLFMETVNALSGRDIPARKLGAYRE